MNAKEHRIYYDYDSTYLQSITKTLFQTMTAKRFVILVVALCTLVGATTGGTASMPIAPSNDPIAMTGGPTGAATLGTTTDESAASADPTGQVSDCDLVDVGGNDSTVSVNLTSNTTAGEDGNVNVQLRCEAGDATAVDHDLVDIDGNNNTVRVVVGSDNGSVLLGEKTDTVEDNQKLHVALGCDTSTLTDCDLIDVDGNNNSVTLVVQSDAGKTIYDMEASGDDLGANDDDDDGDGAIDEDDESDAGPSNDDDDGDGCIDEDDERDDGDDGSDHFAGNAEDDDDGDGCIDEDDEPDSGNSDDIDNDGDGHVDEDDEHDNDD